MFCPMVNLVGIKSDLDKVFLCEVYTEMIHLSTKKFYEKQSDENSLFLS